MLNPAPTIAPAEQNCANSERGSRRGHCHRGHEPAVIRHAETLPEVGGYTVQNPYACTAILQFRRFRGRGRVLAFLDFTAQQGQTDSVQETQPEENHRSVHCHFVQQPVVENDTGGETHNPQQREKTSEQFFRNHVIIALDINNFIVRSPQRIGLPVYGKAA